MGVLQEFKEFAVKGNAVELAIGIIVGAAFTKIVNSLVDDILMPPVGALIGGVDFSDLFIPLKSTEQHFSSIAQAKAAGIPTLNIGLFLNNVITFLITAFAVFMIVKLMNRLRAKGS